MRHTLRFEDDIRIDYAMPMLPNGEQLTDQRPKQEIGIWMKKQSLIDLRQVVYVDRYVEEKVEHGEMVPCGRLNMVLKNGLGLNFYRLHGSFESELQVIQTAIDTLEV